MFLKVKVQETSIVINLGNDLESARSVIDMFESNAQYVKDNYTEFELLKPVATIELGHELTFSKTSYNLEESHLVVAPVGDAIGYVLAENYTFADVSKMRTKYKATIDSLKKELEAHKKQSEHLAAQLASLTQPL